MESGGDSYRADDEEKPCRACTDFKSWAKRQKQTLNKENASDDKKVEKKEAGKVAKPCPLTRDELGNHTWSFLHTMAAYYPVKPSSQEELDMKQFFGIFSNFYPCTDCAEDFRDQLKKTPPETDSREKLSQWLCKVHNNINRRLGKNEFDCSLVDERWRTGWKDGSCD